MDLPPALEQRAIDIVRGLAMDAPRQANSGHPGTAMALAPLAHVLFGRLMRHDPAAPDWPDRDHFVLSAGHASILLYSYLFLCGYGLTLDDLRAFRQFESRTPGHPERLHTPGVEVTTGPLGQGFGNAVGMAIAERRLRAQFGADVVDHRIFAIASDGDFEEGVSHEAGSLAGHLGLDHLIAVYDDNHISIDGPTELAYSDDVPRRFEAYGWRVIPLGEVANDLDVLEAGLREALTTEGRPTLLTLRSHIGWPSPTFTDTAKAHGDPFPPDEIAEVKRIIGLPPEETFYAPAEVVDAYRAVVAERGAAERKAWQERLAASGIDRETWDACWNGRGLPGWDAKLPRYEQGRKLATRKAIGEAINATLDGLPGLMSGAADLTGNTGTKLDGAETQSREHPGGRQIHYGIREFGMATAMNGMAAHGGVLPVGGTFFVFSDYCRPAIRLAALSQLKSIFVFTHDSVGLGEDGPTHQPIEHLMSLRAMPCLQLIRPADANETAEAWRAAVEHGGPTLLVLSRQDVEVVTDGSAVERGAGVVVDGHNGAGGAPDLVLVGTGAEVALCVHAARALADSGVAARVVSMPSWDRFAAQPADGQAAVLPAGVPRLSVEAGATFGWSQWVDASVGIDRYGASAPGTEALERLGMNVDNVVRAARALLAGGEKGA